MRVFETIMTERQQRLNELSKQQGTAMNWFDYDFHPSFLLIDEYVACRSLFPKKAEKNSDYCLATFDALIKRIVTMGASAGCYVIISIAEASFTSMLGLMYFIIRILPPSPASPLTPPQ